MSPVSCVMCVSRRSSSSCLLHQRRSSTRHSLEKICPHGILAQLVAQTLPHGSQLAQQRPVLVAQIVLLTLHPFQLIFEMPYPARFVHG